MNLAESITKKIEADASSYSVTALHLCSEKTAGIDHSWARPLAREVIALLVQLHSTHSAKDLGLGLLHWQTHVRALHIKAALHYRDATTSEWKLILDQWSRIQLAPPARRRAVPMTMSEWVRAV